MAMKFKTFRLLVISGGLLAVSGAYLAYSQLREPAPRRAPREGTPPREVQPREVQPGAGTPRSGGAAELALAREALSRAQSSRDPYADPMLKAILARIPGGAPGDKVKDAFPSASYKVNLYGEGGQVTRLKVDLDRDEKWDEKWTLSAPGQLEGLKRQVSEADDEVYGREYLLEGGAFRLLGGEPEPAPGAQPPAPEQPPAGPASPTSALAPHERQLIERVQAGIGGPGQKLKDPWKEGPKVNVYHDEGEQIPNRAKVDLDRDGKWDEKWSFEQTPEGLKVKRQVSSADDDALYDREYRLREGKWALKE